MVVFGAPPSRALCSVVGGGGGGAVVVNVRTRLVIRVNCNALSAPPHSLGFSVKTIGFRV